MTADAPPARGPFRVDDLQPGDPYELSHGELVYVAPTGGRGSGPNLLGGAAVAWDPAVSEAGADTGYAVTPDILRAPDVAIGNVPDAPGWVRGAPLLAIEYADVGQNEERLAVKIDDLLSAGTKQIWVVRLTEPRHVEIHAPGAEVRTAWPGERLKVPGVLKNAVLVEALYSRSEAQRMALDNLLQREGYDGLEAIRAQARQAERDLAETRQQAERDLAETRQQAERALGEARAALRDLCEVLGIALSPEREAELSAMDERGLHALRTRLKRERRWD